MKLKKLFAFLVCAIVVVLAWNIFFHYAYRKEGGIEKDVLNQNTSDQNMADKTATGQALSGKTEQMDPAKEAKAVSLVLKDVRDSHLKSYTIGKVGKESISDVEFRIRYAQAVGDGSADPYDETVADLTKLKNELAFVKKKNIEITPSEVEKYTNEQRNTYRNEMSQEQRDWETQYIEELGLTQDEYWGKYKNFYNTRYLNHLKAMAYAENHNLKAAPIGHHVFHVTDRSFTKANFHEKALDGVKF